jgi:hypothetical protein
MSEGTAFLLTSALFADPNQLGLMVQLRTANEQHMTPGEIVLLGRKGLCLQLNCTVEWPFNYAGGRCSQALTLLNGYLSKGKYLRQSLDRLKLFPMIIFDSSYSM